MILFQNKLLRGNRATKLDNNALLAFDSPNMSPLASMDISINGKFSIAKNQFSKNSKLFSSFFF